MYIDVKPDRDFLSIHTSLLRTLDLYRIAPKWHIKGNLHDNNTEKVSIRLSDRIPGSSLPGIT